MAVQERNTQFRGYRIYHRSRGKNAFGATLLTSGTFYLDSNFNVTELVSSEDSVEHEANLLIHRLPE
jgi:hypothetical protein